jgi:pimeloyl-ACP methyl ester carboxylesterase
LKFFSGFQFKNEEKLFEEFLKDSPFTVAGFSYGSILAFQHTVQSKERVDTLQLFSPAFFQESGEKFIRTQLFHFKKGREAYIENFQKNSFFPKEMPENIERKDDGEKELEELLRYVWREDELQKVVDRGVKIEVFLGSEDRVVDSQKAREFFLQFATVCFLKGRGHSLQS